MLRFDVWQVAKEMLGNVALFCTYDLVLSFFGAADSNGPAHGHPVGESLLAIWPAGSLAGMAYYTVSPAYHTTSWYANWKVIAARFKPQSAISMELTMDAFK